MPFERGHLDGDTRTTVLMGRASQSHFPHSRGQFTQWITRGRSFTGDVIAETDKPFHRIGDIPVRTEPNPFVQFVDDGSFKCGGVDPFILAGPIGGNFPGQDLPRLQKVFFQERIR